ncbi:hypothetical protein [Bradyrhizobium liaoningense]|uniref:hypothetical protein n=1 Tax=Bradyrhizobium liaoningense TaxID=43992 RepID=UPI001BADE79B|nr:hypothetical protein [Bradyrhizobium liaoningense]MBR0983131.1 hypothetical protein [Bradyrhizobium liaoningense]
METALLLWSSYGKDIVLAVLGLLGGGIISFLFYKKSLQRTELSFACEYSRFIWFRIPAFSDVTLLYKQRELRDPRRVLFFIWNSGNTTIDGTAIASADPLRLKAGNVQIINAAIIKVSRDVNCATAQLDSAGDVTIGFDYLDAGDGFTVEILYDVAEKQKGANTCPDLLGTIKGIKSSPVNRDVAFENRALKRFGQSTALLLLLFASAVLLFFQIYEITSERTWFLLIPKALTALLLFLAAAGMVVALLLSLRSYRIPMCLKVPDEADNFPTSYTELVEKLEHGNQLLAAQNLHLQERTSAAQADTG